MRCPASDPTLSQAPCARDSAPFDGDEVAVHLLVDRTKVIKCGPTPLHDVCVCQIPWSSAADALVPV